MTFAPAESLKALTYFEGGDLQTLAEGDRILLTSSAGQVHDVPTLALKAHSFTL